MSRGDAAEVLVLGAGVAGLAAARALRGAGVATVVLEARHRLGGRVWTDRTIAPHPVELGAEFVHGDRAATWDLVRAARLATRPWRKDVDSLVHAEAGGWHTMAALRARDPGFDRTRTWAGLTLRPHPFEDLETYLRRSGFDAAQLRYVRRSFANASGEAPERLSAAAALDGAVGGAGDDPGGDTWIVDGYDALIAHLAEGTEVRLGSPVAAVAVGGDGVRVTLRGDGAAGARGPERARAAVIALPLGILQADAVAFDPPLAALKGEALAGLRAGAVVKLVYRLERPPVADRGIVALYARGSPPMWWSSSPADEPHPVWTGFVSGPDAAGLLRLPAERALEAALDTLRHELDEPGLRALAARLVAWPLDPYALGGYSHVLPGHAGWPEEGGRPGRPGARERLAAPTPPLAWAGEATAPEAAAATVHGALTSGRRAAQDVLAMLGGGASMAPTSPVGGAP